MAAMSLSSARVTCVFNPKPYYRYFARSRLALVMARAAYHAIISPCPPFHPGRSLTLGAAAVMVAASSPSSTAGGSSMHGNSRTHHGCLSSQGHGTPSPLHPLHGRPARKAEVPVTPSRTLPQSLRSTLLGSSGQCSSMAPCRTGLQLGPWAVNRPTRQADQRLGPQTVNWLRGASLQRPRLH